MSSQRRTRIKICGIAQESDVHAAADAGADLVGFMLWPASVRAVSRERARSLAALARSRGLAAVAVVVDPRPDELAELADFDHVQCHGAETCAALAAASRPVIKGFSFTSDAVQIWDACPHVAWLLVDGPRGGSGESFDHAALAPHLASVRKPVLVAGGLSSANVATAIRLLRPFGVDVSSGVERTRGVKDAALIAAFCAAVRTADDA